MAIVTAPRAPVADAALPPALLDAVNAWIAAPAPPAAPSAAALTPIPEVLTVREVATLLRLDRKTVYDAAARGELPARRVGRRVVIARTALETWLAGGSR